MKDAANKLSCFVGQDLDSLTIFCKDRALTFNPKISFIYFGEEWLFISDKRRAIYFDYKEIIDIRK